MAYNGNGDGGQYVVIVPSAKLIAVRQIDASDDTETADEDYADFESQVLELAEATGAFGKDRSPH